MLGAAESDAFSTEIARNRCIIGRVRVSAHTHGSKLVGPLHQGFEIIAKFGIDNRSYAQDNVAAGSIDGQPISAFNARAVHRELVLAVVDRDLACADHARLAPTARDDGRVTGWSARRSQDGLRGIHSSHVFG